MISKDEIKCAARRFAWRSCVRYVENKRNWEAGFNMGYDAANKTRAIKTRQELYGLLRIIFQEEIPADLQRADLPGCPASDQHRGR